MSQDDAPVTPVEVDVEERIMPQIAQVWALRLMPMLFTIFLLIPTQAPPGEEILTTSWLLWGSLFLIATALLAHLLSGTEARALRFARRDGGTRLRIDEKRLSLPHLATLGPARDRAIKSGQALLSVPWKDVHAVTLTGGNEGVRSIMVQLEEAGSGIFAADCVYIRLDVLGEYDKSRILELARRHAGAPDRPADAEPLVRQGLSAQELETNRKVVLGTTGVMGLGAVAAAGVGVLDPIVAGTSAVMAAGIAAFTAHRIQLEIDKRRRGR